MSSENYWMHIIKYWEYIEIFMDNSKYSETIEIFDKSNDQEGQTQNRLFIRNS